MSFGWWSWLSEPTRVRPRGLVPAAEQQFQPFDEEIIWTDRWFAWWSEPVVKVRPRLIEAAQQWLAFPPPFNAGGVQSDWSGPAPSLVRFQSQAVASFDPLPFPFLGGGGGWYLPDPTVPPGEHREPRKVKQPGAPREVVPKIEPPTFADVLGAQHPAKLADVLGANFADQLARLAPPPLDLYVPSASAVPASAQQARIAPALTDRIADEIDARDAIEALHALDEIDRQEREFLIASVLSVFAKQI